jgi:hypothetical protein
MLTALLGCASLGLVLDAPVQAQHHHGYHRHHHGQLPPYDPASETTLEGVVDELLLLERPGCAGCEGGTHVILKGHEIEIHLGPSSFLESNGCRIGEGDSLRVTGSKLTIRGDDVLLAKELRCGEKTVVLRDDDGRPRWSAAAR